jgi:hypothetical protein
MLRTLAFASVTLLLATPSYATTLYVSATGSGGAPCAATAPCGSFNVAATAASIGDTIVCLSPPQSVPASITKSITIDCSGTRAQARDGVIQESGGALVAIFINIAVSSADPLRTVRLRGLTVEGADSSASGRGYDRGIDIQAATAVYIEDCVISNVKQQGIYDRRTGGQTKLFIKDTIVSNNAGPGIVAAAAAPGVVVVLDNVRMENNLFGLAAASGNNVVVNRSVMSGNSAGGVVGDGGAQVVVNNSTISHNNVGVFSSQSVRLSNNDIAFNATAISGSSGTFGNNRFSGNGTMGTSPAALGGASSDLGQQ